MTIHKKKRCKKAKWLSEEALQITVKEEKQKAKEKRKDIPFECRVSKNARRDNFIFISILAAPQGMWDLSSLTRD